MGLLRATSSGAGCGRRREARTALLRSWPPAECRASRPHALQRLYRIHGRCVRDRATGSGCTPHFPEHGPGTNSLSYMIEWEAPFPLSDRGLEHGVYFFLFYTKDLAVNHHFVPAFNTDSGAISDPATGRAFPS
ncbi:hypothetical protein EVAR_17400_1 [Eumeta japonica]|uniref:Uncharacterized protein n=1 Tax=Eumeta variegata TaxID=151549 RepID=A0A4C1VA72_EUMVA|nr:hypothetical protein EVAR_17400_1 [Eumeta japonica]